MKKEQEGGEAVEEATEKGEKMEAMQHSLPLILRIRRDQKSSYNSELVVKL